MTAETPMVRTGQGSTKLSRFEFERRYRAQFADPVFDAAKQEVDRLTGLAWEAYDDSRKSPHSRKAGPGFADPEHELSLEWLETRAAIQEAQKRFEDHTGKSRILLISASPRTDETCPSEMAKTFRVTTEVRNCMEKQGGFDVDFLDLSQINSEYGRQIHPCKACVSTAMPLCHWPCSCYPNHYMGQIHDWMNELYPTLLPRDSRKWLDFQLRPLCPHQSSGTASCLRWKFKARRKPAIPHCSTFPHEP